VNEYKPRIDLRKSLGLIVLGIALMVVAGWLLARENLYQMLEAVKNADHPLIALAIALHFVSVAIWAIRWQAAMSFIGYGMSFGTRYAILSATIFLNNITPVARVGGDPFGRVYMSRKLGNANYSSSVASVVGEHTFTPLVIVSFLMAGLILRFGQGSVKLTLILAVIWILVALGAVFGPRLFFRRRIGFRSISSITNRVLGWFGRRSSVREIVRVIEAFYSSAYAAIGRWRNLLAIGSLTFLMGALDMLRIYIIFMALGYHPPLAMFLIATSLPAIVGFIPFLPGGLILIEGSFISVFALFGVPLEVALAATLIERAISFVLATMVGAGVFSYLGVKMAAKPGV